MPEGPEIRRAADKVARVLVGNTVEHVAFGLPRLRRFEKRLSGSAVTAVDTRGKAMLTRFDNGLTIYSHNQLYGRWYTARRPRMRSISTRFCEKPIRSASCSWATSSTCGSCGDAGAGPTTATASSAGSWRWHAPAPM